jgi:hypothetical protein
MRRSFPRILYSSAYVLHCSTVGTAVSPDERSVNVSNFAHSTIQSLLKTYRASRNIYDNSKQATANFKLGH